MSDVSKDAAVETPVDVVDPVGRSISAGHERWLFSHEADIAKGMQRVASNDVKVRHHLAILEEEMGLLAAALLAQPGEEREKSLEKLHVYQRRTREDDALYSGGAGPVSGMRVSIGARPILCIVFGGLNDIFNLMRRLSGYGVSVVYLSDTTEQWYMNGCDGTANEEDMLSRLSKLTEEIPHERIMVVGQSMGGYAALRYAGALHADLVMAWSPQTHVIDTPPPPGVQQRNPPPAAPDIRPLVGKGGLRTEVFVSRSETKNPPEIFFWNDFAHLDGLSGREGVSIHVVDFDEHTAISAVTEAGKLDHVFESMFALLYDREPLIDMDNLVHGADAS